MKIRKLINSRASSRTPKGIKKSAYIKKLLLCTLVLALFLPTVSAFAAPAEAPQVSAAQTAAAAEDSTDIKAISAAVAIAISAAAAAIAMGMAISKSTESIARQPEAEGSIRTNLLLGLVFIETTVIYALVIAIIIIFVL